jgi:DNA polymerase-3 subunit epsilon
MIIKAPSSSSIIEKLYHFIGDRPIIAHNASFDSRFLQAELKRINKESENLFLCTLKLSRRLIPSIKTHKLSFLKGFINFNSSDVTGHKDHRALDDVKVTICLWNYLLSIINENSSEPKIIDVDYMHKLLSLSLANARKLVFTKTI